MSLRVLIVVTHLLGAGHLTRAAAIGRALADAGDEVTLVSGGRPTPLVTSEGLRLVRLPPLQAKPDDFTTLLDQHGLPAGPDDLAARRVLLLQTLADAQPDVILTELFPFGRRALRDEFMALLAAADGLRPQPLIACSVRDILVAPAKPEKVATAHETLGRFYDAVLVHGDPTIAPLEASWPVGDGVGAPVIYTGYVDGGDAPRRVPETGEILVSGGSSAAALPLYHAALVAARLVADHPWRILVGRGVQGADMAALATVAPPNVLIEHARPDFRNLMAASALFVGQAGYNTVVDLLAAKSRALLVPFEQGNETEQRLRAELLAAHGVATVLPEAELSADRLAAAVLDALARPRPARMIVELDGARRTAEIIAELAKGSARSGARLPA